MSTLKNYLALIRKLPLAVNLAWLVMHIGLGIMIVGLFEARWPLVGCGAAIVILAGASTFKMKGDMAVRFSTGIIFAAIGAVVMMAIVIPICLVAMAGLAIFDEFSWHGVLGTLRLLAVIILFTITTGVAGFALREPGETPSEIE